jgi:hypothetical protein
MMIADNISAGLDPSRHLGLDPSTSPISLTSWINLIRVAVEERGMDTVFRIYDPTTDTELYMLDRWGAATVDQVEEWIKTLSVDGVPSYVPGATDTDSWTITTAPVCHHDVDNLTFSGKVIERSIDLALWEMVEREMGTARSGPLMFLHIVRRLQQTNAPAIRNMIEELRKLSIRNYPGQNAELLSDDITTLCRKISGAGSAPPDLAVLVATCYIDCDVMNFQMSANKIEDAVVDSTSAMTWQSIVQKSKDKYRDLVSRGRWTPAGVPKTTDNVPGLLAATDRNCWRCNQPGHRRENCPNPPATVCTTNPTSAASTRGGGGNRGRRDSTRSAPAWMKEAPDSGASTTKVVHDKHYTWCAKCKHWLTGEKRHETHEHVDGWRSRKNASVAPSEISSVTAPSANNATVVVPASTPQANNCSLQLNPSLFMAISDMKPASRPNRPDSDDDDDGSRPPGLPNIIMTPQSNDGDGNIFDHIHDEEYPVISAVDRTEFPDDQFDVFYDAVPAFHDVEATAASTAPFATVDAVAASLACAPLIMAANSTILRVHCHGCDGTARMRVACRTCNPSVARLPALSEHGYLLQTAAADDDGFEDALSGATDEARHGQNGGDSVESIFHRTEFGQADDDTVRSGDEGRCFYCGHTGLLNTQCNSCRRSDRYYDMFLNYNAGP